MDLNKYSDLQQHLFDCIQIVNQHVKTEKNSQDLDTFHTKFSQEIEVLRKSEKTLMNQLQILSGTSMQDNISSLYTNLKGKYNELSLKYDKLQEQYILLQEDCSKKISELKEKCFQEKEKIIQEYEEKQKALETTIDVQKQDFLKKEKSHYNELQTLQASTALQYDEMESRLKTMLHEANRKLHESNQSCNAMREELLSFKARTNCGIDSNNKYIQKLERKLQICEQQLQITQEKLYSSSKIGDNNFDAEFNRSGETADNDFLNKHSPAPSFADSNKEAQPHHYENSVSHTSKTPFPVNKYTPLVVNLTNRQHKEIGKEYREIPQQRTFNKTYKTFAPPLKQVSTSGTAQSTVKRRRLYNPNCLDYLDDMEQIE